MLSQTPVAPWYLKLVENGQGVPSAPLSGLEFRLSNAAESSLSPRPSASKNFGLSLVLGHDIPLRACSVSRESLSGKNPAGTTSLICTRTNQVNLVLFLAWNQLTEQALRQSC